MSSLWSTGPEACVGASPSLSTGAFSLFSGTLVKPFLKGLCLQRENLKGHFQGKLKASVFKGIFYVHKGFLSESPLKIETAMASRLVFVVTYSTEHGIGAITAVERFLHRKCLSNIT